MNISISAIALACLVGLSFSADPRMEQGARFEAKGDFEMALGEYRAVLAENPKSAEAYFAAAQVRMKMKDYSGALANYRLAYKFEPTMSAAYEGAAKVYEALGQKAKADAERAKDPKNNPVAAEPVQEAAAPAETPAATEAPKADAPKAETAPAAPVAEAPKTAKAPEPKPVEKTAEVAKPEPAKVAETKAAEPAKEESAALPTDPFEKGKVLFAEGKYKEAAPLWREVLRKQPGHAGAYFYAGLTRYELGEMDKAEFNLKKGLEYKEEGNDANFFLAKIAQKSNKSDQELKFLAAYMKKAAPNAKYRAAAEARIAEIKAEKESKNQSAAADSKAVEPAEAPKTVVPAPTQVAKAPVAEPKVADIADAPCKIYEVPCVATSAERAWISIPGKIKEIYGFETCSSHPFVKNSMARTKPGDSVDFPRNNVEKCGNAVTLAKDRNLAVESAENAVSFVVQRLEKGCRATDTFLSGKTKRAHCRIPLIESV